jgi:hypothetical protein
MPIEINNTLRGTSIIRVEGTGTYYINVSDLRALSPTPRKSERERKNISYDKMNKGEKDDSEDLNMRDTGIS